MKLLNKLTFKTFAVSFVLLTVSVNSLRIRKEASLATPTAPTLAPKLKSQMVANEIPVSNQTKQINVTIPNNTNSTGNNTTPSGNNTTPSGNNTDSNGTDINRSDPYYVPYFQNKSDNTTVFEPVRIVKELSPAGKRELEIRESGDYEYFKILNSGYETPKFTSNIIDKYETPVTHKFDVDYNYRPIDSADANLWKNIELNKYQNDLVAAQRKYLPAKFTKDELGDVVVHAPEDSGLRIIKAVPNFQNVRGFLSLDDHDDLLSQNDFYF